ncbi:hypothetical protein JW935_15875 [candidate division KSB1 bacterium]|nr:hypothetical protein [candidate division KSB1 bacterium]
MSEKIFDFFERTINDGSIVWWTVGFLVFVLVVLVLVQWAIGGVNSFTRQYEDFDDPGIFDE